MDVVFGNACSKCAQRTHTRCAQSRPCACRERGHVSAREYLKRAPLHTDAFTISADVARAFMGDEGTWGAWAYKWCARERAYHLMNERASLRITIPGTARVRTPRTSAPEAPVRVRMGADGFAAEYDARRTYPRAWGSVAQNVRERAIARAGAERAVA